MSIRHIVANLAVALFLAACGAGAEPDTAGDAATPPAAGRPDRSEPPADSHTAGRAPADSAADAADVDRTDSQAAGNDRWTVQTTRAEHAVTGAAVLAAMRTARHDTFDRIVLDFGDGPLPGYTVEYVDRPVTQCGSGDVVELAGAAWLKIQANPAHAHTEEGRPTVQDRSRMPGLPNLLELRMICDFEAYVDVVAGLAAPEPYRIVELTGPARLVVDIRHPRR